MRVLHVSQPVEAGVANVVRDLAHHQAEAGLEVAVACPGGSYLSRELEFRRIPHRPWAAARNPGPAVLREAFDLARVVREVDPDVVHLHSTKAGLAGRLALRGRVRTVFEPHAWGDWAAAEPVASAIRTWERGARRWTDLTICLSDAERSHAERLGVVRAITVPNGVDTERFAPRDKGRARAAVGLGASDHVSLCVGRLARQKGQDLLVQAWQAAFARNPAARLVLVGAGPDEADLRALARDRGEGQIVFVTGCEDPRDWYAAADVVVAPSRWEGAALVPLEAMSMGRPVVGFDVGGLAATIGRNGTALAPGDVEGLTTTLARVGRGEIRFPEQSAIRAHVTDHHSARRAFERITVATTRLLEVTP